MLGGGSITLFRVRGIRVGVDWSWFFVLFLVIFWLSDYYEEILAGPDDGLGPYALAVASALLFFVSILLHELGHAFVAIRRGIGISGINLWMFGGVARMTRDSDSAGTEFRVAVAGPLVTLAIAATCVGAGIGFAGADEFWMAMRVDSDADTSGALAVVAWLATINLAILAFNLIPAFPLDGGRIARAVAWKVTGNRSAATRFAARLGRGFSYVFIGVGIFWMVQGGGLSGAWLAVIGFILGQAARAAEVQTQLVSRIEGIAVADVMDREPVAIPDDLSVERALDEFFLRYRWPWFPVVDAAGRFRGLLQRGVADAVPAERRASDTVGRVIVDDTEGALQVREDAQLEAILGNESLRRLGALVAVDATGKLLGVITLSRIGRALKERTAR